MTDYYDELARTVVDMTERTPWVEIADVAALLRARFAPLVKALEAVEWVWDGWANESVCPWCMAYESDDHKPDCQRQLALAPFRKTDA